MKPHIVLYQTDIAQNFGTIVRSAVAFGLPVHVIEPLGFVWDEPKMRRAGMDYLERADLKRHKSWEHFLETERPTMNRLVLMTTKGSDLLQDFTAQEGDYYLFGRESAGVPDEVHAEADARIRLPMIAGERSINLAQSCSIIMFESLRQLKLLP